MKVTGMLFNRAMGADHGPDTPESKPNEYAQLKALVRDAGLLEKNPGHYALKLSLNLGLLALCIAVLVLVDNVWIQVLNAAFLAFIMVQLCFIGHDVGHDQVFRSNRNNDRLGLFVSLLVGINRTWWVENITSTTETRTTWLWTPTLICL